MGRKEPLLAQGLPILNVDNSFDRHVCFIIGSFSDNYWNCSLTKQKDVQMCFCMRALCGLQIANFYGCRRAQEINNTFSILKDGRTQQYMQVWLTF